MLIKIFGREFLGFKIKKFRECASKGKLMLAMPAQPKEVAELLKHTQAFIFARESGALFSFGIALCAH
ncbi:MAG: hypothetical protein B9J98_07685 [Candidatus Terraquivivens tikiterensis]|uniref:Uncharacterized protein n=1 Tax=Candidatus Terraquivivens tikiterensis TaxID=1980982 RepID=A0A2R7Y0N5_9ARCH|nr:MAG: hypothetical protein B9J98_07685 [Candidatus Terraquivivens tikiterensis]